MALVSSSWPGGRRTSLVIGLYVYVEEIKLPDVKFQILRLQSCDPETAAGIHSVDGRFSSPLASAFKFSLGRRRTLVTGPVWPRKLCNRDPVARLHTLTVVSLLQVTPSPS